MPLQGREKSNLFLEKAQVKQVCRVSAGASIYAQLRLLCVF